MSDLRITGMAIDEVQRPRKVKRRHGVGAIEAAMPGVIIRIDSDAVARLGIADCQ